jgi:hypothetical protein
MDVSGNAPARALRVDASARQRHERRSTGVECGDVDDPITLRSDAGVWNATSRGVAAQYVETYALE